MSDVGGCCCWRPVACSACRPLIKSFVSLPKDGRDWTMDLSWMSTKALILSVGARVELTIGLPGGLAASLCIFGRV